MKNLISRLLEENITGKWMNIEDAMGHMIRAYQRLDLLSKYGETMQKKGKLSERNKLKIIKIQGESRKQKGIWEHYFVKRKQGKGKREGQILIHSGMIEIINYARKMGQEASNDLGALADYTPGEPYSTPKIENI